MSLSKVLTQIAIEREKQDEKWGQQNHPDGTQPGGLGRYRTSLKLDLARDLYAAAEGGGDLTWIEILGEEVAEAFAEPDPQLLRAELLQVAAVAVAWIECIDRRLAATTKRVA
jgi:hypothetical protein